MAGRYKLTKLPIDFPHKKPLSFIIMTLTINLSTKDLLLAAAIKKKIESLEDKLLTILGSPEVVKKSVPHKRRKMSMAGRRKIAAAQKARWAKVKGRKSAAKPVKLARRKMSAEARKKIAAAAKARWAKAKAAGKTRL